MMACHGNLYCLCWKWGCEIKGHDFCDTPQIYAGTVKLLTEEDLRGLGLRMGERVMMQQLCSEAAKSKGNFLVAWFCMNPCSAAMYVTKYRCTPE